MTTPPTPSADLSACCSAPMTHPYKDVDYIDVDDWECTGCHKPCSPAKPDSSNPPCPTCGLELSTFHGGEGTSGWYCKNCIGLCAKCRKVRPVSGEECECLTLSDGSGGTQAPSKGGVLPKNKAESEPSVQYQETARVRIKGVGQNRKLKFDREMLFDDAALIAAFAMQVCGYREDKKPKIGVGFLQKP